MLIFGALRYSEAARRGKRGFFLPLQQRSAVSFNDRPLSAIVFLVE